MLSVATAGVLSPSSGFSRDNSFGSIPIYKISSAITAVEIDAGNLQTGGRKTFEFAVQNWTGATWRPGRVRATCGCTDIQFTYFDPQGQPEISAGGGVLFFRASIKAGSIEERKGVIVQLFSVDDTVLAEIVINFKTLHLFRSEPVALQVDLGDGDGFERDVVLSFVPNFEGVGLDGINLTLPAGQWGGSKTSQTTAGDRIELSIKLRNPRREEIRSHRQTIAVNIDRAGQFIESIEIPILLSGHYRFFPESIRLENQSGILTGRCSVLADQIDEVVNGQVSFALRDSSKASLDVRVEKKADRLAIVFFKISSGIDGGDSQANDFVVEVFHHENLVQVLNFF
jgi:hypothetical protein